MPASKQHLLREQLQELFDDMAPGDLLPSERDLSARLGVSRATLRKGIDEFVRQGSLVRRHGAGTFVAGPKFDQPLRMTSFTEDMQRRRLTPSSRTLALERRVAGPGLAGRFGLSPAAVIVHISRLRLADLVPMALESLYVPETIVPDLTEEALEGQSFYELLATRYGVILGGADQTIEATVVDEDESQLLAVPLLSPALLFQRTSYDDGGRIVEYVRSVYRGDRYRLTTPLHRAEDESPGVIADGSTGGGK